MADARPYCRHDRNAPGPYFMLLLLLSLSLLLLIIGTFELFDSYDYLIVPNLFTNHLVVLNYLFIRIFKQIYHNSELFNYSIRIFDYPN